MTTKPSFDTIQLSGVLLEVAKKLNDPDIDRVMKYATKIIERPDMNPDNARVAIAELEALAFKFGFAATYYKNWGKSGTEERYKKDAYYTARDATRSLVDALKYLVRMRE